MKRLNAVVEAQFFSRFVRRYPDKQYQTWLGADLTMIGVDFEYDRGLQDRVFAGIANYFLDYSFSSALKLAKGVDHADNLPPFELKFDAVEQLFFATTYSFLQADRPHISCHQHNLLPHAELFLLRLLTSFKAARRLMNWGFFSEPLTILRSSLEQLAWAYSVGVKFNKKQLDNPKPSKCIGEFSQRFKPAGLLYGQLSRFSHMDFEGQKHFVTITATGGGVMQQSIEFKFFGLLFYAYLMIAYQYVCRNLRDFYCEEYDIRFPIRNVVLPLQSLLLHALQHEEIKGDLISNSLAEIYSLLYPSE